MALSCTQRQTKRKSKKVFSPTYGAHLDGFVPYFFPVDATRILSLEVELVRSAVPQAVLTAHQDSGGVTVCVGCDYDCDYLCCACGATVFPPTTHSGTARSPHSSVLPHRRLSSKLFFSPSPFELSPHYRHQRPHFACAPPPPASSFAVCAFFHQQLPYALAWCEHPAPLSEPHGV